MKTILYLHGFRSSENARKAQILKKKFDSVISPTLPISPKEAIDFISNIISEHKIDLVIGSSLGGFYAYIIHKKYQTKTLFINPSFEPWESLKNQLGEQTRFVSDEIFYWKEKHIQELKELFAENSKTEINEDYLNFFIANDDDLLNHSQIPINFKNSNIEYFDNAGHTFTAFLRTIPKIKKILEKTY